MKTTLNILIVILKFDYMKKNVKLRTKIMIKYFHLIIDLFFTIVKLCYGHCIEHVVIIIVPG
jgi:hypothetical protein